MRSVREGLIAVVLVALASGRAHAQTEEELERARTQFAEAVELLDAERWSDAAERFRDVLAVRASAQVKYNLAIALERLGQLAEASELLDEVAADRSLPRRTRREAAQLRERLEPRLARLTVRVAGDTDRITVTLDGDELGLDELDRAIAVDPGTRRVVLLRGGETIASREVRIREGQSEMVELRAPPAGAASQASSERGPSTTPITEVTLDDPYALPVERGPQRGAPEPVHEQWWFWTTIGLAAAVVLTIIVAVATSQ